MSYNPLEVKPKRKAQQDENVGVPPLRAICLKYKYDQSLAGASSYNKISGT